MQFDVIYTSLLRRAHQTVEVIVREMHYEQVPVYYNWRLNERHYGNLTGFNKRQVANKYGEEQVSGIYPTRTLGGERTPEGYPSGQLRLQSRAVGFLGIFWKSMYSCLDNWMIE